ncbi:methionine--tRNA ligase subunit beta [Picrophilus oshimae]|uniref:Methionine--tRNA ligase n=1 Tax=Picrophilus torridus (strain ATCC 700027 / DSM 9790 / JCM 10055 / NBRC 100828 / KAW 2/3) TaxID=1122961 RepID=Q6L0P3_PICTO|nr:methionine--tRNA ligase subunit beta [Picrophilus oshimae]AAT43459.1 methionyl-tRNA synthetase [Picrophilus oshimae DSM 9789]
MDQIDIDHFHTIDLRVARVIECEKVEKSRSLLRIILDLGDERKQIVSSIADYYKPEDIIGRNLIIINNLKPAKFMGIESQGMLLAAEDESGVSLLTTDKDVKPGTRVH